MYAWRGPSPHLLPFFVHKRQKQTLLFVVCYQLEEVLSYTVELPISFMIFFELSQTLWSHQFIMLTISLTQLDFFKRFYLFTFRQRGSGGEKGRETSICGCLSHASKWEPGPKPRHGPWLGIELVTFWFAGRCSTHWASPGRTPLTQLGLISNKRMLLIIVS